QQDPLSGPWYITPWTNAYDEVLQTSLDVNVNPDDPTEEFSENYKARPITVLLQPSPDLVVTSLTPQVAAVGGDTLQASWPVKNQGPAATTTVSWNDAVYLSDRPDPSDNTATRYFLGSVPHGGTLTSGASYTASATFHLAPNVSGKYVQVITGPIT